MSLEASKFSKFKYTEFEGSLLPEMAIYHMILNIWHSKFKKRTGVCQQRKQGTGGVADKAQGISGVGKLVYVTLSWWTLSQLSERKHRINSNVNHRLYDGSRLSYQLK